MFQNFVYIVNFHYFRSIFFSLTMVLDMQIQNRIYFNSIQLFHIWLISGQTFFCHHGLRYANTIQFHYLLFNFILSYFMYMFQNFFDIWIISGLTFFIHHGLRSTDVKFNSFQFQHMHTSYLQRKIFDISKSADTTYSILFYLILRYLL